MAIPLHLTELLKNDSMRRTSKMYIAGYKERSFQKYFHRLQGVKKSGLRRVKLTALRIVLLDSSAGGMVLSTLRRGPDSCSRDARLCPTQQICTWAKDSM